MSTMATGALHPNPFYVGVGCLYTSCGWIDAILYSFTRRVLASDSTGPSSVAQRRSKSKKSKPEIVDTRHIANSPHGREGSTGSTYKSKLDDKISDDIELGYMWEQDKFAGPLPLPPHPVATHTVITAGGDRQKHDDVETSSKRRLVDPIGSYDFLIEEPPTTPRRSHSADEIAGRVKAETRVEVIVEQANGSSTTELSPGLRMNRSRQLSNPDPRRGLS